MYSNGSTSIFRGWSVRSKLVTAYGAVGLAMVFIAIIAIRGFSSTQVALDHLHSFQIPEIIAAIELSDASSSLAALAPAISLASTHPELQFEQARIAESLAGFATLVDGLAPGTPHQKILLDSLANDFIASFETLSRLLEQRQSNKELLLSKNMFESDRTAVFVVIYAQFGRFIGVGPELELFNVLTDLALAGTRTQSLSQLERVEAEFRVAGTELHDLLVLHGLAVATKLEFFLDKQFEIFELRKSHLKFEADIQLEVVAINSLSGQLRVLAEQRVSGVSDLARLQGQNISQSLTTNRRIILGLGVFGLAASILAMIYVIRDLAGNLVAVATNMSKLAKGDHSVTVHGEDRTDELGTLARAFGVFRDSSLENQYLAEELSNKTNTLEATFSNMTDGLSVFDNNCELRSWNPQFIFINGFEEGEVKAGMRFVDFKTFQRGSAISSRSLEGEVLDTIKLQVWLQEKPFQFYQFYANGKCVELRSKPLPDGGFVTSYTDRTNRRAMEQKLLQANRMEAVGKLTGGIAHDFNNMLAAITGNLQLLQGDLAKNPLLNKRTLRALDAAERGAAVTERLLAFASQQSLEPEPVSINELVDGLKELIAYGFNDRVLFATELQQNIPFAFVDPGQLESALLNLVFNSRDAMPDGGTIKIVTAQHTVSGKDYVSVSVIDSGEGMTPDVLAHAYEPFFTTKNRSEGTGLGLSMVYGFTKQSGGLTAIESIVGEGTCVEILLPVSKQDLRNPVASECTNLIRGTAHLDKRILLVEDDSIVRETAFDMIEGFGYAVVSSGSFEEAQTLLNSQSFDLLFTDLMLPAGKTGIDVANFAKNVQPDILVIFSSGYAKDEVGRMIAEWENAVLVPKPYRKQKLARCLASQLRALETSVE